MNSENSLIPYNEGSAGINVESRAQQVTDEVRGIKATLVKNLLYLGELLSESRANEYPQILGYDSFGRWLDDSGLDMSERQAYYLIKIIDTAKQLGITQNQLASSKMSKLKEIFSLNPEEHGERIKELVVQSADLKLDEIRHEVNQLRIGTGLEPTSWCNFRVTDSQAIFIAECLQRARMRYGQVINPKTNEVTEATDGTLLADVICSAFVQYDQNEPQQFSVEEALGDVPVDEVEYQ